MDCELIGFFYLPCSCKEYNNWYSFFAVVMALNSAAVGRLSQTWEVSIKGGWIDAIQFHPRLPLHD